MNEDKVKGEDYKNYKKKKGKVTSTKIYHVLTIVHPKIVTIVKNMEKTHKMTFGNKIMNNFAEMLVNLQYCYSTEEQEEKLKHLEKVMTLFSTTGLLLKYLSDTNVITIKQYGNLIAELSDINSQLSNWIITTKKRINENV